MQYNKKFCRCRIYFSSCLSKDANNAEQIAVLQDMEKCSQAMNISEETMKHATNDLEEIVKNSSVFLNAIWSLFPFKI